MNLILISFAVTFVYVGLRAFQQLNVMNSNYLAVMPTSILMGIGDVVLILMIVKTDSIWMGVSNGIGGGLGCCLSMYMSKRFFGRKR